MSPPTAPADDPLLLACRGVGRAMDLFDESAAQRLGVGRSDLRALNLLEHGPLSSAALADQLGLSRTAVTVLVDRLIRAGYVSRTPDRHDRRSVRIELEPATWKAFAEVYRPLGQRIHDATAHLDRHDRAVVVTALVDMQHAFDAARARLA